MNPEKSNSNDAENTIKAAASIGVENNNQNKEVTKPVIGEDENLTPLESVLNTPKEPVLGEDENLTPLEAVLSDENKSENNTDNKETAEEEKEGETSEEINLTEGKNLENKGIINKIKNFLGGRKSEIENQAENLSPEKKETYGVLKKNKRLLVLTGAILVGASIACPMVGGLAGLGLGSGFIEAGSFFAILEQNIAFAGGVKLIYDQLAKQARKEEPQSGETIHFDESSNPLPEEKTDTIKKGIEQTKNMGNSEEEKGENEKNNNDEKESSQENNENNIPQYAKKMFNDFNSIKSITDRTTYLNEKVESLSNKSEPYLIEFFKQANSLEDKTQASDDFFNKLKKDIEARNLKKSEDDSANSADEEPLF